MTTEKKMTKYDRNFKFNVSYAEVGQKYEEANFCKAFVNSQFANQFIKDVFENNPEMVGKGMYFVAFDSFPLYTVEYKVEDGIRTMVARSYYGTTDDKTEEADVEDVKAEESKDEPKEMEIHDAPKKQVAFTQLWKSWESLYASDYKISKAAAQRWLKAYPALFATPEVAADSLRDYVVELMKED